MKDIAKNDTTTTAKKVAYRKPRYEVTQKENVYYVDVFMPGVAKDTSRILLDNDMLTIEASRLGIAKDTWSTVHREIPTEDYRLELQLNVDIDSEGITAHSKDGVLSVRLPVSKKAAQRTIKID